jgi:hypothetical protein
MKNLMKIIVILTSAILLTGCVEESYTSEYYSNPSTDYYDSVTSGYNRDYNKPHHNRDRGYYSAPSTSSNSSGYTSSGSTGSVRVQQQAQPVQRDSGYHSSGSTDNSPKQPANSGYSSTGSTETTTTSEEYKSTSSSESAAPAPAADSGYGSSSSN